MFLKASSVSTVKYIGYDNIAHQSWSLVLFGYICSWSHYLTQRPYKHNNAICCIATWIFQFICGVFLWYRCIIMYMPNYSLFLLLYTFNAWCRKYHHNAIHELMHGYGLSLQSQGYAFLRRPTRVSCLPCVHMYALPWSYKQKHLCFV